MWKCPKCGKEFKNTNQSHFCGEKPKTIEEYIMRQDKEKQADLFLVRQVLQQTLLEAEERISCILSGMSSFFIVSCTESVPASFAFS